MGNAESTNHSDPNRHGDNYGAHQAEMSVNHKANLPLNDALRVTLPAVDDCSEDAAMSTDDAKRLQILVEHDNHKNRRKMENLVQVNPIFHPYYNLSLDEMREYAIRRLRTFCEAGCLSVQDFERNPSNVYTCHEAFGMVDGSFATKMTVQFNLFGGTVFRLGSKEQREALAPKIDSAEVVGCFGLSELGYGNNAVEMETTSTYDANTDEWIINSPTVLSQKYWITNGACHAHYCVVFAQMLLNGKNEGVHAFLVPIRDQNLREHKNVRVEDMGIKGTMPCLAPRSRRKASMTSGPSGGLAAHCALCDKIGLNGIDNAKLFFDNVRVPREALLSSQSQVDKDGKYHTKIKGGARARFLKLADQLLSGRLCISAMALSSSKVLITNTLLYGCTRNGVGPSGKSDTPIIDYQLFQNQTFPLLAKCFALNFYYNYCKRRYAGRTEADHMDVVILCSSIKPQLAWFSNDATQICREKVGGVGFLAANGFGEMFAHAAITAEGDARVLQAKVTKELLELVQKGKWQITTEAKNGNISSTAVNCMDDSSMSDFLHTVDGVLAARLGQKVTDLTNKLTQAFTSNEGIWKDMPMKQRFYKANLEEFSPEVQNVAQAHADWEAVRHFIHVIDTMGMSEELIQKGPDGSRPKQVDLSPATISALQRSCVLFATMVLQADVPFLVGSGLMTLDAAQDAAEPPTKKARTAEVDEGVIDGKKRRRDCPYLGSINRNLLDFDFEKVCSISLTGQNVYVDLVDGKYFQGRGRGTLAYKHALEKEHYVWMNLANGKVYCIPDDYEVVDRALDDIKYNLNPTYDEQQVLESETVAVYGKALEGTDYIPGVPGLNNLKATDYLNAVVQALNRVIPLRNFFLQFDPKTRTAKNDAVTNTMSGLFRKIWNTQNFKGIVSPHEFVQAVGTASKKRFFTIKQQDPVAFMSFLFGHCSKMTLPGFEPGLSRPQRDIQNKLKAKDGGGIISECFQGQLYMKTTYFAKAGEDPKPPMESHQNFNFLSLELPSEPLFKDKVEFIPQIQLFTLLEKFNGETPHEITRENAIRRYCLQKLPPYLIMHVRRFKKNNFFTEKNPTIVNFPLKNLDLKDYIHPDWVARNPETHYDLVANVCHEGKPTDGTWKAQVYYAPKGEWFETQDLRVTPVMPQMVALSESYIMIYKRQDVQPDGTFSEFLPEMEGDDFQATRMDVEPEMDAMDADELAEAGLQTLHSSACKSMRPDAMRLVSALGVHHGVNMRPLAKDWHTWNKIDNFGEVVNLPTGGPMKVVIRVGRAAHHVTFHVSNGATISDIKTWLIEGGHTSLPPEKIALWFNGRLLGDDEFCRRFVGSDAVVAHLLMCRRRDYTYSGEFLSRVQKQYHPALVFLDRKDKPGHVIDDVRAPCDVSIKLRKVEGMEDVWEPEELLPNGTYTIYTWSDQLFSCGEYSVCSAATFAVRPTEEKTIMFQKVGSSASGSSKVLEEKRTVVQFCDGPPSTSLKRVIAEQFGIEAHTVVDLHQRVLSTGKTKESPLDTDWAISQLVNRSKVCFRINKAVAASVEKQYIMQLICAGEENDWRAFSAICGKMTLAEEDAILTELVHGVPAPTIPTGLVESSSRSNANRLPVHYHRPKRSRQASLEGAVIHARPRPSVSGSTSSGGNANINSDHQDDSIAQPERKKLRMNIEDLPPREAVVDAVSFDTTRHPFTLIEHSEEASGLLIEHGYFVTELPPALRKKLGAARKYCQEFFRKHPGSKSSCTWRSYAGYKNPGYGRKEMWEVREVSEQGHGFCFPKKLDALFDEMKSFSRTILSQIVENADELMETVRPSAAKIHSNCSLQCVHYSDSLVPEHTRDRADWESRSLHATYRHTTYTSMGLLDITPLSDGAGQGLTVWDRKHSEWVDMDVYGENLCLVFGGEMLEGLVGQIKPCLYRNLPDVERHSFEFHLLPKSGCVFPDGKNMTKFVFDKLHGGPSPDMPRHEYNKDSYS
eukprot:gene996-721_t